MSFDRDFEADWETVEINVVAEVRPEVAPEPPLVFIERRPEVAPEPPLVFIESTPEVACDVVVERVADTLDEFVVPHVFAEVEAEMSCEVSSRV